MTWSSGKAFASGWTPDGVSDRLSFTRAPTGGPCLSRAGQARPARAALHWGDENLPHYTEVSACAGPGSGRDRLGSPSRKSKSTCLPDATGDHQWIHVDPERAEAGLFGAPIAHGFLTLSLIPKFFDQGIAIEGARMGVNYGLNRVRFTAPVPVGSRLRARLLLQAAERIEPDGMQMTWLVTVEREGSDKPVCVAESLARNYGAAA